MYLLLLLSPSAGACLPQATPPYAGPVSELNRQALLLLLRLRLGT